MKNNNSKIKLRKAFTLIELILFMGIFSILIVVFTDIFITSLKTKSLAESTAYVNQDGRFLLTKLTSDINNANSITAPDLGSTSSTLSLILYGQPVTFQINNGNLELIDSGGTHVMNSFNTTITNLAFTRLGNADGKNSIRINMTVESKTKTNNRSQIINLETSSGLR